MPSYVFLFGFYENVLGVGIQCVQLWDSLILWTPLYVEQL